MVIEVTEPAASSGRERREDRGQTGGQWKVRGPMALVPMSVITLALLFTHDRPRICSSHPGPGQHKRAMCPFSPSTLSLL